MNRQQLVHHAFTLLSNRPHTSHELLQKLLRVTERQQTRAAALCATSGLQPSEAASEAASPHSVVDELLTRGVLSDQAYAEWHTLQRTASRPRSRLQLLAELGSKRVGSDIARDAIARGHSELASCAAQALRRPAFTPAQLRKFLTNKGFARAAMDRVLEARLLGEDLRALAAGQAAAGSELQ